MGTPDRLAMFHMVAMTRIIAFKSVRLRDMATCAAERTPELPNVEDLEANTGDSRAKCFKQQSTLC